MKRLQAFPSVNHQSLIPGVNFTEKEPQNSILVSDCSYAIQGLQVGDQKQTEIAMLKRVVDNFYQLLGRTPSKQTDIFLNYLSYQTPF